MTDNVFEPHQAVVTLSYKKSYVDFCWILLCQKFYEGILGQNAA